ncbi:MAG TPA: Ldh family oxidoreductase [Pyrinomonadaceae bacterium]|nr:Ldh family oxidoreductase [Pyrinomonadaceae bacterium]
MTARCFEAERLREFCSRVFQQCGVPAKDAAQAADVLITADLWGIDSHGVARLRSYYDMLSFGHANPRPRLSIVREMPGTATIDGDNGLGLVIGSQANAVALDKAEMVGSGWVSIRNSNHFGIAGYYAYQALARDMIGWTMTNTTPQVAPLWGIEKMLGTNPIAIAFPGKLEPPVVIDMATSAVSFGFVECARQQGRDLPDGLAVDSEGRATHRPEDMMNDGSLLPLGQDRAHGAHKGYCLSAMIDILCGVLSGANWGPFVPPFPFTLKTPARRVGKGIGHLFGALKIEGFIEPDEFKRGIDEWIAVLRATRPSPGAERVLIPGDPERQAAAVRVVDGIPLGHLVVEELRQVSSRTSIPFE